MTAIAYSATTQFDQKRSHAFRERVVGMLNEAALSMMISIGHRTGLFDTMTMHCMTVSLAQGGDGLGTDWGEELALDMLNHRGFRDVRFATLDHDFLNNDYIMAK
jgi:phosphoribosylaminoimidazole (AIR) synthetase